MFSGLTHRVIRSVFVLSLTFVFALVLTSFLAVAHGQDSPSENDPFDRAGKSGLDKKDNQPAAGDTTAGKSSGNKEDDEMSFLSLLFKGGWFMFPLLGLSILVVVVTIERSLALRRSKVLPDALVTQLGALGVQRGGFDPRDAYLISQQHPSSAARVVQTMLQKVGRPISEIESVVGESSQREADRLHANVRWLTLSAAVAPLIGLLGTVWGMIQAFHDTTKLLPGQDKGEMLAQGIYVALVTTLAGLMIAIPAAVFAHFFETRITQLFHRIDEFVFSLIPQVERYEGQLRFSISEKPIVADAAAPAASGAATGEAGEGRPPQRKRTPAST